MLETRQPWTTNRRRGRSVDLLAEPVPARIRLYIVVVVGKHCAARWGLMRQVRCTYRWPKSYSLKMKPAILLLATTLAGYGQPGIEPPKYEVASIKRNTDNEFRFAFRIQPDGSLAATGITLKRLLMTVYNVQDFRIVGGPEWVASSRWDLQAKPNRAASPDEVRQMLRTLLEDRFRLRFHSESRKMPVYELAVDRKGSRLPRVKDGETEPVVRVTTGSIQLTKATPATFASQLSYALGQPVVDKTSLSRRIRFRAGVDPGNRRGWRTHNRRPAPRSQSPAPFNSRWAVHIYSDSGATGASPQIRARPRRSDRDRCRTNANSQLNQQEKITALRCSWLTEDHDQSSKTSQSRERALWRGVQYALIFSCSTLVHAGVSRPDRALPPPRTSSSQ
jgi:uncharacterized protein (TIGR03435 family)